MPIDLTGIQNVGEFYSHHYLDALLENDLKGLFARWREDDDKTPDRRLAACASAFFAAKTRAARELRPAERFVLAHKLHVELLEALGYGYDFGLRYLTGSMALPILSEIKRDGHPYIWLVETVFPSGDDSPLDQGVLPEQYPKSEDEFDRTTDPWESVLGEVFRRDEPPRWVLLFAGRFIYLIDRTKWRYGQYLLFDLDEILGRKQTPTLRATAALLSRVALCPDEGVPLHDTLDENSHKHAYGVSTDLKYGVRRAVELLANEYVWYRLQQHEKVISEEDLARRLTRECLTYLYRLLFLFYAEARGGELDIVPMKSDAYRTGYSLESLRDLEQVPLTTPQAQNGYFIHESVTHLFRLVNDGYQPGQLELLSKDEVPESITDYAFELPGLHNPLFSAESTPLLSKAKFRNVVLQEVIQLLSLSRETRGRNSTRGRISYAQLGINQLGAVYEGLLSYTGFFAQENRYEVKPADAREADETAQTYFVPESEIQRYTPDEFVYTEGADGTRVRKSYPRGTFIFRLAGRDREKLASYYTPEVLTQCVVKYSLKELLRDKRADDFLQFRICEMALGSGAFVNEALNQLADGYLERKQKELARQIPTDEYREEKQKVKAFLAVNNAYGVDLNPTAIELARVSIWLNTIYRDAASPWFGARLAVGNSLIGARHQVYSGEDVLNNTYREKAPTPVPLSQPRPEGSVYHWLLPDRGMAAFDSDKVVRELAPKETKAIKEWRKKFTTPITVQELRNLQALSERADALWAQHTRDRQSLLERTREAIPVWGQEANQQRAANRQSIESKEKELDRLYRPTSPFRRLKMAMDYWCALWFWPIPGPLLLPTRQQFWNDISALFAGVESEFVKPPKQLELLTETSIPKQAHFADLRPADVDDLCRTNARLKVANGISEEQHFHHWELAFAEVFADHRGFDLLLGNPPWLKVTWNESGILSEYDPLLVIRKKSASDIGAQRIQQLNTMARKLEYLSAFVDSSGALSFLDAMQNYPILKGVQTNLYKCFIVSAWTLANINGRIGLLHPEGVYDDPNGGSLRRQIYPRLKSHFQFQNELKLFPDVAHVHKFSVNVYRPTATSTVEFNHIVNLFLPLTVDNCFMHDGVGTVPGIRDTADNWETRGHRNRIIHVDEYLLGLFCRIYDEPDTPSLDSRLPLIHSIEVIQVLKSLVGQVRKLGDRPGSYFVTRCFEETAAQKDGIIKRRTCFPENPDQWILSGPHFFIASPFNKNPNENCRSHGDYSEIDLVAMPDDFLPRTNYVSACSSRQFQQRIPKWNGTLVTDFYRQAFRAMLNPVIERTLIGCIIPKRVTHINAAYSYAFESSRLLLDVSSLTSSIVYDFLVKSTGKQNLHELPKLMPIPDLQASQRSLLHARTLRLNCLTVLYADLWGELYSPNFRQDGWAKHDSRLRPWIDLTPNWQRQVPLRTPLERRQALAEIDVLVALVLNLTLDELITIYRVQFPVLQKNERRLRFDQRGMEVPMKTIGGELVPDESDSKFGEMVPPFTPVDREADYREAWKHFEGLIRP